MLYPPNSTLPEAFYERAVVAIQRADERGLNMPQSRVLADAALKDSGALAYITAIRDTLQACLLREDIAEGELGEQIRGVLGEASLTTAA